VTIARWDLPADWRWATIGDIGDVYGGGTPPAHQASNFADVGGFPWITPSDMSGRTNTYIRRGRRNLTTDGLKSSGAQLLPAGTVVYSSRAPIGYCAVAAEPISTSQGCKNIVLHSGNVPEYLMYYLRYSKAYAESFARGTTFLELSASRIKTLAVPIPPTDQQEAIAIALEQVLGRIQQIREILSPIPAMAIANAERVLADAYDGKLTEKWRESHVPAPPSRRRIADLLAIPIQNGLSVKGRDIPPGVRALRLSSLRSRKIDLDDVRFLPIDEKRSKRFLLEEGDVLVSRGNGTRSLVGRAALTVGLDQPTIYPDTAFRLRSNKELVLPEWLSHILNSPQIRNIVSAASRTTAGIWKIRQSDITELPLIVPTLEEQRAIVTNVDNALARLDSLQSSLASAIEMLGILEANTLSLAFRGAFAMDAMKAIDLDLSQLRVQALEAQTAPTPGTTTEGPMKMRRALKSRFDPEVKGQPFLASLLAAREGGLSAKSLFEISTLSIVDFYKQLAWEVDNGHLDERTDGFWDGR